MIQIFDIQDKRVVPHSNAYLIPELKVIIELFPEEYIKILTYIAFMTIPDASNPYINIEEMGRENVILNDLKPFKFYVDDMKIELAKKKCEMLMETPTLRIQKGAKAMLEEMARNLTQPLTFGKDGNATDMRGIMKEIRGFTEDYMKIGSMVKEEQAKVRGDMRLRYDQKPTYVDMKADKEDTDE